PGRKTQGRASAPVLFFLSVRPFIYPFIFQQRFTNTIAGTNTNRFAGQCAPLVGKASSSGAQIFRAEWSGRFLRWERRMLDEGFWAEVKVGSQHLRLFSEHNAQGVQASVYDVNSKRWIAPSEAVDDIEQGKERATQYAAAYLRNMEVEVPPV